ncbi:heparinase II/III family protein [Pseudovibrio sp. Ad46]|uniref:heparinase II/III family protein n=1 Tax=Pseudovibrio sp. Ad46 TaxID=989432 RepID=UPI0007AE6B65|nr:heparinase II/III family protein [Pseudovibrio sp. Ad46]
MAQNSLNWARGGSMFRLFSFGSAPSRLLIAPQDLRTADATNAADIYAGRFLFAGHLVEVGGQSPFDVEPPNLQWSKALHGFSWLRHLRAAETNMAQQNARALVEDWIRSCGRWHDSGWKQEVVARRVLSWMAQSPLLLTGCEADFYRAFMRSLYRQVRYLRRTMNKAPDGLPRLTVAMANACATVSMDGQGRHVKQALKRLDQELKRQILPDGGHISRHPGAIIEILVDLLPIRQALVMQGQTVSPVMMESIDRMMPMIRFFRHGDGSFAHFNGMASTPGDVVATILAYDDARGTPPVSAPHSGYQRLTGGDSLVMIDVGAPPPTRFSSSTHAGCLSFEFSSKRNRIVVNCGVSTREQVAWKMVARSTAAHSTAGIGDTSSCRFLTSSRFDKVLGNPVLSGPKDVEAERQDTDLSDRVIASHDGYVERYGIVHERDLTLSRDGTVLDGIDRFKPISDKAEEETVTIRFHLHPQVSCTMLPLGDAAVLQCADGEAWEFSADGIEFSVEESIYLSDVFGHRQTQQIVLSVGVKEALSVTWMLRKTASAKARRKI